MTILDYSNFVKNGNFYRCAAYVDNSSVGNKDGRINGKEEERLFCALMETAFGVQVNLNENIQKQADKLAEMDERAKQAGRSIDGKRFLNTQNKLNYDPNRGYTSSNLAFVGNNCGYAAGMDFAGEVIGNTSKKQYIHMTTTIKRLTKEYCPELNDMLIRNFLSGYYYAKGKTDSGFFEQLAHENDSSKITNGDAVAIMKRIIHAVPLEQRESYDYKQLMRIYQTFAEKPQDELFEEKQSFGRLFGTNEMDNLDDAIENLFNL